MTEQRGLQIPYVAMGAVVLWLAAIGLLAWVTKQGAPGDSSLDEWAMLTGAAAAVWSVIASQCMTRRKMAEAVARRIALQQETERLSRI